MSKNRTNGADTKTAKTRETKALSGAASGKAKTPKLKEIVVLNQGCDKTGEDTGDGLYEDKAGNLFRGGWPLTAKTELQQVTPREALVWFAETDPRSTDGTGTIAPVITKAFAKKVEIIGGEPMPIYHWEDIGFWGRELGYRALIRPLLSVCDEGEHESAVEWFDEETVQAAHELLKAIRQFKKDHVTETGLVDVK